MNILTDFVFFFNGRHFEIIRSRYQKIHKMYVQILTGTSEQNRE